MKQNLFFTMRPVRFALLGLLLVQNAWALTWDDKARLLGGFEARGNDPVAQRIMQSSAWQTAARSQSAAESFRSSFLPYPGTGSRENLLHESRRPQIDAFLRDHLGPAYSQTKGVIYLFGGADILFSSVLFPTSTRTLIVGLENPGQIPDPAAMDERTLARKMSQISHSLRNILTNSYFVTDRMREEFAGHGAATIIAVELVALGNSILDVRQINIDSQGEIALGGGVIPGVQISYRKANGQSADVIFLSMDVSNGGIQSKPGFSAFINKNDFTTAFYKAAMYLPKQGNFTASNRLVMNKVNYVVQNDDGIPLQTFGQEADRWSIRLYGIYSPPHGMFPAGSTQSDWRQLNEWALCQWGKPLGHEIWTRIWRSNPNCANTRAPYNFAYFGWYGSFGFHFGYSAISGPDVVSWEDKKVLGNVLIAEKVR